MITTEARSVALSGSTPVRMAIGAIVFAIATGLSAKLQIVLPGNPVPVTFQPALVILAGALLGPRLGAASQILYLGAGIAGIPAFAFGGGAAYLLGPTGGYLVAYPLAAFAAGALGGEGFLRSLRGLLAGLALIYAGGLSWLAMVTGSEAVLAIGLTPFILADLVKATISAALVSRLRAGSLALFGGR